MKKKPKHIVLGQHDYNQQTQIIFSATRSLNAPDHWCSQNMAALPSCRTPGCSEPPCRAPYLSGDQQAVGVLDGRALVQQQGLKLPLLDVIEGVEHNSEKLQREDRRHPYTLRLPEPVLLEQAGTSRRQERRRLQEGFIKRYVD